MLKFDVVKAYEVEGVILFVQDCQFDSKHFPVPASAKDGQLIVCDYQSAPLGW